MTFSQTKVRGDQIYCPYFDNNAILSAQEMNVLSIGSALDNAQMLLLFSSFFRKGPEKENGKFLFRKNGELMEKKPFTLSSGPYLRRLAEILLTKLLILKLLNISF